MATFATFWKNPLSGHDITHFQWDATKAGSEALQKV